MLRLPPGLHHVELDVVREVRMLQVASADDGRHLVAERAKACCQVVDLAGDFEGAD